KGVVSSKEESSIESDNRSTMKNISEGARNILDNTPNLIKIPGGILLAHQLYERILSPALGTGTNIMHKVLGVSSAFGSEADYATEERKGIIGRLFSGVTKAIGTVAGLALASVVGLVGGVFSMGASMLGGMFVNNAELLDEMEGTAEDLKAQEEITRASNEAQASEMTEIGEETIAEIAQSGDDVQDSLFDADEGLVAEAEGLMDESKRQVRDNVESNTSIFKKAATSAIKYSPMGMMYALGKKTSEMFKNAPEDIKKQFESEEASPKNVLGNVFSNIMKMSPLYYLGWKASQTKNKLSN